MLCEPVRSDTDKARDMWKVFAVLFQPNDLPFPSQSHFLIAHKYVYRRISVLASLEIHIQQKSCTVKFSIRVSVNMEIWIRFRSEATLLASRGIITLKCIHRLWNVNLSNSVFFFLFFPQEDLLWMRMTGWWWTMTAQKVYKMAKQTAI